MNVELLHNTPLIVADTAIGKCWDKCSATGEVNEKRMHRVGNKFKHASTLEHVSYNFDISGISRALLQELARHRIASLSVKSSRYTLGELKNATLKTRDDHENFVVFTNNDFIDIQICKGLQRLQLAVQEGISNDLVKYCMPEAYKTSLVWTINMRSLQNFIALRSNKSALWEIRELAVRVYNSLPKDHQFMFVESLDPEYHGKWTEDLNSMIGDW